MSDVQQKPYMLITGCSGLIGKRIVQAFHSDYVIIGLDIKEPDFANVQFIKCDLTDSDDVNRVLSQVKAQFGEKISTVIHLAAYYDFSGEPSPLYEDLTVQGTKQLITGLQEFEVDQFLFSSSMLVMKPSEGDRRIDEFSPEKAEWDYPQSKLRAEQVLRDHHEKIPVVILRIAGVYDDFCNSLPLSQQIRRIYEKQIQSHVFPGDQESGQSLLHLDDLVACIKKVCQSREQLSNFEIFLVGEEEVMSYGELQEEIGKLIHNESWTTITVPKPVAKVGAWVEDKVTTGDSFIKPWMINLADDHYAVDLTNTQKKLNWKPQHHLRDTLPKMIDHLTEDPQTWYEAHELNIPSEMENNS